MRFKSSSLINRALNANNHRTNIGLLFLANFSYALSNWFQLSLIAKYTDGKTLGDYTLIIAIISPLYLFFNLQLRSLILTDNNDTYGFSDYFHFRLLSNVFLSLTVFAIGIGGGFSFKLFLVLLLFLVNKLVESNAEIINSHFQKKEKMQNVAMSITFKSILSGIGVFVGVSVFSNLSIGLCLSFLFTLIFYLAYDRRIGKKEGIYSISKINWYKLQEILFSSLPLGIAMTIISFNAHISKYFLEEAVGTEQQGVYSSISYTIVLGAFVCNAVGQAITPKLSQYYDKGETAAFLRLHYKFVLLCIFIGCITILFSFFWGKALLTLLFNNAISKYDSLFQLLMIDGLIVYIATALVYQLSAMKGFKQQLVISIIVLGIQLLSLPLLINKYGLYGAVYSLIITHIIQIIVTVYCIQKMLKNKLRGVSII